MGMEIEAQSEAVMESRVNELGQALERRLRTEYEPQIRAAREDGRQEGRQALLNIPKLSSDDAMNVFELELTESEGATESCADACSSLYELCQLQGRYIDDLEYEVEMLIAETAREKQVKAVKEEA